MVSSTKVSQDFCNCAVNTVCKCPIPEKNDVFETYMIPVDYKYLPDFLDSCLGFHFTFPCLLTNSRSYFRNCKCLGSCTMEAFFFCHWCLEIGTVKDIIFEQLNIAFHFLKGVCTWSTDILIKPTYEMRNPDSKLRGGEWAAVRRSSRNEAQCLIGWILSNLFTFKHFDKFQAQEGE